MVNEETEIRDMVEMEGRLILLDKPLDADGKLVTKEFSFMCSSRIVSSFKEDKSVMIMPVFCHEHKSDCKADDGLKNKDICLVKDDR